MRIVSVLFVSLFLLASAHAAPLNQSQNDVMCRMLFMSAPQIVDVHGEPLKADRWNHGRATQNNAPLVLVETGKNAEISTFKALLLADSIPIYSKADVQKALESLKEGQNKDLRETYEEMLAKDEKRFLFKPSSAEMLDGLADTMPNYAPVIQVLKRYLAVAVAAGTGIRLPPIILLGDPGVGKTFFAKALARALNTSFEKISMASATAGWILSGASAQWKDARMGKVARTLLDKDAANPVVLVDEIDKANGAAKNYDPLGSLYELQERADAKTFVDEYLGVPIDASHVIWIATANYKESIPEPLRNRAIVVHIKAPTPEQMRPIVKNALQIYLDEMPNLKFSRVIGEDVFAAVTRHTPRDTRKLIEYAVGNALLAKRTELKAEDIDKSILEMDQEERTPMGFGSGR